MCAAGDTVTRQCDSETTTDYKRLWGKNQLLKATASLKLKQVFPFSQQLGPCAELRDIQLRRRHSWALKTCPQQNRWWTMASPSACCHLSTLPFLVAGSS